MTIPVARAPLLEGKKGLIVGIANDRSIAWHIAVNCIKQGARCGFGYLPIEKMERRVRKAMEEGYDKIDSVYKDAEFAELRKDKRFSELMAARPPAITQ